MKFTAVIVGPERSLTVKECRLSAGFSPAWMYLRGVSTLAWNTLYEEEVEGVIDAVVCEQTVTIKSASSTKPRMQS